jgi:hypothetical protein
VYGGREGDGIWNPIEYRGGRGVDVAARIKRKGRNGLISKSETPARKADALGNV